MDAHTKGSKNIGMSASHVRLVFALVIVAVFLDVVDFSVVNVAVPAIKAMFVASLADVQWVIGAYGITMAGFLLLSGRAGDIYGQKKLFVAGVILFTVASLAAALSPSLIMLIAFRAIQGIGAAMSSVTAFAIFMTLFPEGPARNKAMGAFIAVLSGGFAAGSVLGGFLTTTLGWRSVLLINVPIGIVATILIQRFLLAAPGRSEIRHLDLPGAVTITAGIMLLIYSLTVASGSGFGSVGTLLPLVISIVILAAFFAIEARSKAPLVPIEFLKRGVVLSANSIAIIIASVMGGTGFIVTFYLQQVLGYSALWAGLGFLPPAAIFFVLGGWGTGWFTGHLGLKRTLLLSTALITVGLAGLTQLTPQWGYIGMLPWVLVWALGAAMGFPAFSLAAIAGARRGEEGLASGLINTSMRLGFPLGLAGLVTVASITDPASSVTTAVGGAAVQGFDYAFAVAAVISILAFIIAFRMRTEATPNHGQEEIGRELAAGGMP